MNPSILVKMFQFDKISKFFDSIQGNVQPQKSLQISAFKISRTPWQICS